MSLDSFRYPLLPFRVIFASLPCIKLANIIWIKIKGGFLEGAHMTASEIIALADLPPLPVVRGQLLGVISAPASKLVRTLIEPGRSLAQVLKAHADAAAA